MMTTTTALLVGLVPALLTILGAVLMRRSGPAGLLPRRMLLLFEISALFFLALVIALQTLSVRGQWITLFTPTIIGLVLLILINLPYLRQATVRERVILLLPALVIAAVLIYYLAAPYVFQELIAPLVVLALMAWLINRRPARWVWILVAVVCVEWSTANGPLADRLNSLPRPWMIVVGVLWIALPALTASVMALLVASGLDLGFAAPPIAGVRSLRAARIDGGLRLLAAFVLLFIMAYSTYWTSIWDQTTDGLGGLVLLMYGSAAAVVCGMVMAVRASGPRRLAGVVFLIVVPMLLQTAFSLGWAVDFPQMTERRAAQVAGALQSFHEREKRYPASLNELVPRDLLAVPQPVMFRGETWCYQGTADAYRLAAFYHQYFGLPVSLNVYASAGDPGAQELPCKERLADMQARYDWTGLPPVNSNVE